MVAYLSDRGLTLLSGNNALLGPVLGTYWVVIDVSRPLSPRPLFSPLLLGGCC